MCTFGNLCIQRGGETKGRVVTKQQLTMPDLDGALVLFFQECGSWPRCTVGFFYEVPRLTGRSCCSSGRTFPKSEVMFFNPPAPSLPKTLRANHFAMSFQVGVGFFIEFPENNSVLCFLASFDLCQMLRSLCRKLIENTRDTPAVKETERRKNEIV